MSPRIPSRRALQVAVAAGGCVPVAAGLSGALLGAGLLGEAMGPPAESHLRYLSGLLLGLGLGFWSTIPGIERQGARFRLLTAVVVLGGLARLLGLALAGPPGTAMLLALVMELGVTPLLCLWQARIAAAITR